MNQILDDVVGAFGRVAARPRSVKIDRKGVVLPAGGHFQSIQRTSAGRLAITSSSDAQAYFVMCDMTADGTRGRANAPVQMASKPLKHAGGSQLAGNVLAAGIEDDVARRQSEIQFWNLAGSPAQLTPLTIRRSGPAEVSTAGAVGVSAYAGGTALAVATWGAQTVDFYTAAGDPLQGGGGGFQFRATWSKSKANKTGWIDGNFGSYQCLNMVTQRDGRIFLVGFNRSGGDDWMDLFAVDLAAPPASMLRKVAKKHMYCSDGCSFEYGAGVYVGSSSHFDVYAVKGDSGDHRTGTTISVNCFPAG